MTMTLPNSHKIVVIDDKLEEVSLLLSSLSKKGIGFLYFNEKLEQLPATPLQGIRIVFSDIDLVGAKDDKTKISALIGVLKKIISPDNGPYIIVFWTKHSDLINAIETQWNKEGVPPLKYLCIEKSSCQDKYGQYSMELIDKEIQEQTKEFQAFNFYLDWENALVNTGESFIRKFHNLVPRDQNWSHNICHLLYRMFLADSGDVDKAFTPSEQFSIACRLFNKSFNNELDCNTAQIHLPREIPPAMKGSVSPHQIVADINSFLWIHNIESSVVVPGEVNIVTNDFLKYNILNRLFKGTKIKSDEVALAKIIVTPSCDIAQGKLFKNDKGHCLHRVVYAVILESSIVYSHRDASFYYQFGPFLLNGKNVRMHFHFGTLDSEYIPDVHVAPLFVIKQEIVFDIQSKIANHMNRLGNSLLDFKI